MENNVGSHKWIFEKNNGSFALDNPHGTSYLYFPLANEGGMMSSITPMLGGDIKSGQNNFLMAPVSAEDLHNSRAGRNFWLYIDGQTPWSAAGTSPKQLMNSFEAESKETVKLEAGFLWHKIIRENKDLGIKTEITNFVPAGDDKVELMRVKVTNVKSESITMTPTAVIPIYGRSADNIRDHRHVTSLLHKIKTNSYGVVVTPTLSFDERGHKINYASYSVQGAEGNGEMPKGFFPSLEDFIGEGGNLEWPAAIVKNEVVQCGKEECLQGCEALGALRFKEITLEPHRSKTYIIASAIHDDGIKPIDIASKYCSEELFEKYLTANKEYWEKKIGVLSFQSGDPIFDQWMKWVTLQPMLRRIYGCSFLPHHDYGRGGRGWRDLWQDCLALLIMDPKGVRELLLNNYAGVRIDGSNATIIGTKPGEFIADRNNIPRIWMDHGAWPLLTTNLYINQSGDLSFLLEEQTYFKDKLCWRSQKSDNTWTDTYGNIQKDKQGNVYRGTVLEHILIQNLSPFFNVGKHNNIKLEGADWNDAFDMASEKGESVTFSALYGSNLKELKKLVLVLKEKLGKEKLEIAEEMIMLFDSIENTVDYNSVEQKTKLLKQYFAVCEHSISGKKISVKIEDLAKDLGRKSEWIMNHIRTQEWIKNAEGFEWFNGYYDNAGEKLEGDHGSGVRITLTGQVFPIMSGAAELNQVKKIVESANRYLFDERIGGYRLNSNFNEVKLNMGRGFGFAFGHKENGSMFSHMSVMFSNGLYKRGCVQEGFRVLNNIYSHCSDFSRSKIYPGIPEYINESGRGMYHYLTGSASWLMLTVLNEAYGVKGNMGDLELEPKLMAEQFNVNGEACVSMPFADRKLRIVYKNICRFDYGNYSIKSINLGSDKINFKVVGSAAVIEKGFIETLEIGIVHEIIVELG